jgi:hypothetical protein
MTPAASIASRPTFRDDSAYAPLAEAGRAGNSHCFHHKQKRFIFAVPTGQGKSIATVSITSRSDLFLPYRLDRANQFEMAWEFGFCAHADFASGGSERSVARMSASDIRACF